jgi:hypothetical protein
VILLTRDKRKKESTMPLAYIQFLEGGRPDNSLPGGYPGRPDNSLPLPPGSIGTLPVFPFDPTAPDNTLPGQPPRPTNPITLHPGLKLVVKWVACIGFCCCSG